MTSHSPASRPMRLYLSAPKTPTPYKPSNHNPLQTQQPQPYKPCSYNPPTNPVAKTPLQTL